MAQGDPWEISFALPIRNYRFTQWYKTDYLPDTGDANHGLIGWAKNIGLTKVEIRNDGRSAQPSVWIDGFHKGIKSFLLYNGAMTSADVYGQLSVVRKGEGAPIAVTFYVDSGGSVNRSAIASDAADWEVFSTSVVLEDDGVSQAMVELKNGADLSTQYSEVIYRYVPKDWVSSPASYTALDSFPEPDGLFYGPVGQNGTVRRFNDGYGTFFDLKNRGEKYVLRATYRYLKEVDYLTLQRFYLGSIGQFDGIPRQVAIRPYLLDYATEIGPEWIVGRFTEAPTFERTGGLANFGSCQLSFEEW